MGGRRAGPGLRPHTPHPFVELSLPAVPSSYSLIKREVLRQPPLGLRHPAGRLCYALVNMDGKNKLYFGDNLKILRDYVPDASVDLIYLDPPFNSSATYNVLFKEKSGEESAAQIMAFEDIRQPTDSGAWNRKQCTRKSSPAARANSPT